MLAQANALVMDRQSGPGMSVGAQNDLGGHQTFARKMTRKLPDKSIAYSVQIEVTSKKKKKRSSLKLSRFFCPNCADLQKNLSNNMKLPKILAKISTPYSNRGGQCPQAPPPPTHMGQGQMQWKRRDYRWQWRV